MKISELVNLKFNLMFGDPVAQNMQRTVWQEIENVLGIPRNTDLTATQATNICTYLLNSRPEFRAIAFEYHDNDGVLHAIVWEQFRESFSPDWIFPALDDVPDDIGLILYFVDDSDSEKNP
jgi:hypothetical protein